MQVGDLGELFYDKVEPDSDVVTWVYEEGSFTPIAKLADGERFSIVSDYLGTPVQAFDASGELVWERELNIYGGIRKETGAANFVAMRYQGQYFDEETGLCYNRHRYYDPGSGLYLSQDPIGLAGGTALYGYVHDTNAWVDVEGLQCAKAAKGGASLEKASGSYLLEFQSGKFYAGKGLESRMMQSVNRIETKFGDKLLNKTFYPAANSKAAFINEHNLMMRFGGPKSFDKLSPTYNLIFSLGKKLGGF